MKLLEKEFCVDGAFEPEADDEENQAQRDCHDHDYDYAESDDVDATFQTPSRDSPDPDSGTLLPQSYRYLHYICMVKGEFWVYPDFN